MRQDILNNTIRIFNLDFKNYIENVWDENIPVIRHCVLEAVGINEKFFSHNEMKDSLEGIFRKLDFHIVEGYGYQFQPIGSSIVFILEESHCAIHSWPEKQYIHMDIVTCSKEEIKILALIEEITKTYKPISTRVLSFKY